MSRFVAFCLDHPITTLTIHIVLVVLGAIAMYKLPLSAQSRGERPLVRIDIDIPNSDPQQVEEEVTRIVEEAVATIEGIVDLSGESNAGRSEVRARFAYGTNLDLVKLDIRERLARIRNELPVDSIDKIRIRGSWGSGDEIIRGRISSTGIDLSRNYQLLENRLIRPLERIDGVSQVSMDGVTPLEIDIRFRQEDLERHNLELRAVTRRLDEFNVDQTVGEILEGGRTLRLRVTSALEDVDDVKKFPVNSQGIRLGQVADVRMAEGDATFGRRLNGNFAVSLEIHKESNANTVETCRRVLARIEEMKSDPQLKGVDLLVWENQGQQILDALQGLRNAGIIGSLLAMVILVLFLRRVSATALVAMTIPISVLAALAWLYLIGKELNILTLVALMLGVGMLVDTAVVVVESIVRLASSGLDPKRATVEGTMEVATPIFCATVTSIVVFIPVFLGKTTQINDTLRELGLVITLTIASSLFVSLTLIPMVAARIYKKKNRGEGFLFPRVLSLYSKVLEAALRRRGVTLAVTAALVSCVVLPSQFGFRYEFEDLEDIEKRVGIFCNTEGSVDYLSMKKNVIIVEDALNEHKDRIGVGDVYSWYRDNFAWIAVYPAKKNYRPEYMTEFNANVNAVLPEVPGVTIRTGSWRDYHGGGGGRRSAGLVPLRVFGDSSAKLDQILLDLEQRFVGVPGVMGLELSARESTDEIIFTPNQEITARHALSTQELAGRISASFARNFVREIRTEDGETRVRVELDDEDRNSLEELVGLRIPVVSGSDVPLATLGSFETRKAPRRLRRSDRQSVRNASIQVDSEKSGEVRANINEVLDRYPWPTGYHFDLGASWRQRRDNKTEFTLSIVLAIFLVYTVMACLFESLRQPLAMLITVFLAFPGAVWTLYLCGESFDLPASAGMILLVGIVVNNGIVLVDHINRYRRQGLNVHDAILRGGRERLRPILITALTTILGLLPLALSHAQALGFHYYTLAMTIMGGLAISTFLTLLVLPVLYSLLAGHRTLHVQG